MAVKMKQATKQKQKVTSLIEAQVDKLYGLDADISALEKKLSPLTKEFGTIRGELAVVVDADTKPEDRKVLTGTHADLEFGVQPDVVVNINLAKVRELLGDKVFMQIAKVGVGDLEKYLTEAEVGQCVTRERKGTRKIKWIPK